MRWLLGLAILAVPAAAHAEQLRMVQQDSSSLHLANDEGAINHDRDVAATVDLQPKGLVAITATGKRGEHNLFVMSGRSYSTVDELVWTTTWTGTWTRTRRALVLDLSLAKHDCTGEHRSGGTTTAIPCEAPSKRAKLTCERTSVSVEAPPGKPAAEAAWRCVAVAGGDLGPTPAPWILGQRRCIATAGGGHHLGDAVYRRCP